MKYYNNIKSFSCGLLLFLVGAVSFTSCTDWLDKDPDSIVAEDEAFKNFRNFQGYIEEIYSLIPSKEMVNYCTAWNFGDDAVHNPEGYAHMDHQVDLGNYRNWYTNNQCWLNGARSSWYSIRKCNMGIDNIGSLVGTDEERDILLGQMYFFRAWWHFELMCYFGGLPYIDQTFVDGHIPELPRLSFQQCAERCAQDFERAYELLPMDSREWDETLIAKDNNTKLNNYLRVNKFMALCYLGKCYLWAGSPLMKEFEKWNKGGQPVLLGASQGGANAKTYDYDAKFCRLAAEALGKALDLVNKGQVEPTTSLPSSSQASTIMRDRKQPFQRMISTQTSSILSSKVGRCPVLVRLSSVVLTLVRTHLTGTVPRSLVRRLPVWWSMTTLSITPQVT